jgi:tetratricopeptide (TPR) repeat protein
MSGAAGEQVLEEARASLEAGDLDRARDGFRRALELQPGDASALIDLGHLELAAGRKDEAVGYFEQALDRDHSNAAALLALAEIRRRESRFDDALTAALRVAESRPGDVPTALDAADLALELDRLDEAEAIFRRVRGEDDEPEHDVYAYHGLIEIELRRERWRRALDLAVDATRVDRLGRTTEVLAFVVTQVFGESDRPAPTRDEVERLLALSRAEHRRLHAGTLD